MTQAIFILFEGGPLDSQHMLFERDQTGTWPPPRYAYFVRGGTSLTVWAATSEGQKPAQLRGFKIPRYRRISCTVPDDDTEEPEEDVVYGARYRYDPTHDEQKDNELP